MIVIGILNTIVHILWYHLGYLGKEMKCLSRTFNKELLSLSLISVPADCLNVAAATEGATCYESSFYPYRKSTSDETLDNSNHIIAS